MADRIEFEMLQGMAPAQSRVVKSAVEGEQLLLYTPIVAPKDFDVAISYLFRRLEENSAEGNFMRILFSLEPGTTEFDEAAQAFREAVASRGSVSNVRRRSQERPAASAAATDAGRFVNEPDTDPVLSGNRRWARRGRSNVSDAGPGLGVFDHGRDRPDAVDRSIIVLGHDLCAATSPAPALRRRRARHASRRPDQRHDP